MENALKNIGITLAVLLVLTGIGAVVTRVAFYDFVENYEMAYMFDKSKGEIILLKDDKGRLQTGYVFSYPLINSIHKIDLRPLQVCINANSRVLNCKLVQFNPEGFSTFIEWHGRGDYTKFQLEEILKSYAYDTDPSSYSFLTIKKELKGENVDLVNTIELTTENELVEKDSLF